MRAATALTLGASLAVACSSGSNPPPPPPNNNNTNNVNNNNNAPPAENVPAHTVRVHYQRSDKTYTGWGVYTWMGAATLSTSKGNSWPGDPRYGVDTADADGWGQYADVALKADATAFAFLLNNADGTQQTPDMCVGPVHDAANAGSCPASAGSVIPLPDLSQHGIAVWVVNGDPTLYDHEPPVVLLAGTRGMWLTKVSLTWPKAGSQFTYKLHTAAAGGMQVTAEGVTGADHTYTLTPTYMTIPAALATKYPHLKYESELQLLDDAGNPLDDATIQGLLKGQLIMSASPLSGDSAGKITDATQVQIQGVLDDMYATAAKQKQLGVTFDGSGVPTFRLWAPTASAVQIDVYADATTTVPVQHPMTRDDASGVWEWTAPDASLTNVGYYQFDVTVYSRFSTQSNKVITNRITDPYSLSLNANSQRSFVVDLKSAAAQPTGWPGTLIPTALAPTDAVLYELHVRDFSKNDDSVTDPNLKGKFLAFTQDGRGQPWSATGSASKGMTHLMALSAAGLTHIHLLPAFDIATVDEVNCLQDIPNFTPSTGVGLEAEQMVLANQGKDCFNWGYDPYHYGAPEGSYSSDPNDGMKRVVEFRKMVQALHGNGLRVIMDVVYNHTDASGQNNYSVLDKIVPGYYYRYDLNGNQLKETCCADTATEFAMMEKLTTDTAVNWADQYKVDGFRFDLMGYEPLSQMLNTRTAINAVTQADGRGYTYIYGEGWNTGGNTSGDQRFVQARQENLGGTGLGSFNDRIRDGVRGGSPFDSGAGLAAASAQGFISGKCYAPNDGSPCAAGSALETSTFNSQNLISVGLAGNLKDFQLNRTTTGAGVKYNGGAAGYTLRPEENIAYVSVHDNETLWDISQYKHAASVTPADRARAQVVGLSVPILAQGVPLLHAGDDLLRSKSGDSNSYDSGDYFNRVFWDGSANNWSVGAPPQNTGNNASNLATLTPVVTNTNTNVTQSDINAASAAVQDLLRIRKSSALFHLSTADDVKACVHFPDQLLGQVPGLIVMQLGDGTSVCGDATFGSAVVLFNGSDAVKTYQLPAYAGHHLVLHPAQAGGSDNTVRSASFTTGPASASDATPVGIFQVPARTTAVFVETAPSTAFVSPNAAMYVRGSMNTTGTTIGATAMKLVADHLWQVSLSLPAATAETFKFDVNKTFWPAGKWWGDAQGDGIAEVSSATVSPPAIAFTTDAAGTYVIQFNDSTLKYTILPPNWIPGSPTGVIAIPHKTSVTINWTGTVGARSYQVLRSTDNATFAPIGTATATTYLDSAIVQETKYYYQVVAVNPYTSSAPSATVNATPSASVGFYSTNATMYVKGDFTDPTWAGGPNDQMTLVDDFTWAATFTFVAGTSYNFKVCADATAWPAATSWGVGATPPPPPGLGPFQLLTDASQGGTSNNVTFQVPADGRYTITFNDYTGIYQITAAP